MIESIIYSYQCLAPSVDCRNRCCLSPSSSPACCRREGGCARHRASATIAAALALVVPIEMAGFPKQQMTLSLITSIDHERP